MNRRLLGEAVVKERLYKPVYRATGAEGPCGTSGQRHPHRYKPWRGGPWSSDSLSLSRSLAYLAKPEKESFDVFFFFPFVGLPLTSLQVSMVLGVDRRRPASCLLLFSVYQFKKLDRRIKLQSYTCWEALCISRLLSSRPVFSP